MCRVLVHAVGVVHVHRTSSNLLEPHLRRDNKVCRVLPHELGVVRLCRTFSNLIYTGEARCAGCLCTRSGWFKRIEPPRNFLNHIMTEIAGRVEFFHMSSGWFDTGGFQCPSCGPHPHTLGLDATGLSFRRKLGFWRAPMMMDVSLALLWCLGLYCTLFG